MGGTWLGKAAVLWALDEAPDVPASLVSTLVAVARYAGTDGRGAHPSASTVASHTRKSESQAKRDLAALEKAGLLLRGDPRVVASIRADRRPSVYDLPMPRGSTGDTPSDGHGVAPMHARGSTHARDGVAPVLPEKNRKSSRRGTLPSSGPPAPRADARTQPDPSTSDGGRRAYLAPPCPVCGKPFSQELLADPGFRAMAMDGDAFHDECVKVADLQYLRTASLEQLIEDGAVDDAIKAGAHDLPEFIAAGYRP